MHDEIVDVIIGQQIIHASFAREILNHNTKSLKQLGCHLIIATLIQQIDKMPKNRLFAKEAARKLENEIGRCDSNHILEKVFVMLISPYHELGDAANCFDDDILVRTSNDGVTHQLLM